jgi:hypothetical protein
MRFLFAFLFLIASAIAAGARPYSYLYQGRKVTLPVAASTAGPLVNDLCLKRENECQALKVFQGKERIKELQHSLPGQAAAAYCQLLHGQALYARGDGDSSDTLFCVFPDLSLIDGNTLYFKHFERSEGGRK